MIGSTDNSEKIIKKYLEKNPDKIVYKYQNNSGVASARNLGMDIARGEYITYIDSDDYVEPNVYNEICKISNENKYDIVIYDAQKTSKSDIEYLNALDNVQQGEISKNQYILSMPCPWNKIIKKSILVENKLKFPEGICYEDLAMIPLVGQYANKIYYLKKAVVNYYQSEDSIMRQNEFKNRYLDIFKALKFLKDNMSIKYKSELEYIFWQNLLIEFSLIFYKYDRYDLIQKCAEIMKQDFNNWKKNKYIKNEKIKLKMYSNIFYYGKYKILKKMQYLKKKMKVGEK